MKVRLTCLLIAIALLTLPGVSFAQQTVPAGGTGLNYVAPGAIPVGDSTLHLKATTSPTVGYITATSGTSTLPKLSISSAIYLLGDYITNVSTWFSTRADAWLTGKSTTNLAEGSNLYYTDARVLSYISGIAKGFYFSTTSAQFYSSVGLAFSTTSASYQLSTIDKGYFFSTTSDSNFAARGLAYSTTSADYYLSTKSTSNLAEGSNLYYTPARDIQFSTTSAAYYLAQFPPASFSTTSATYFSSLGLAFSTTSADAWFSTKSITGFSTTSADYYITQRNFFSTTSATYFLSQNQGAAFSTTSASFWRSVGLSFSTTSTDYYKSVNNFFSTSSASYFSSLGLAFSTTSADAWVAGKGYLTGNQTITLTGDVTGSGATSIPTVLAMTVAHWWTGLQNFGNASTSQLTATSSVYFTSLGTPAGQLLATDPNGKVIGTTTPTTGATFSTTSASFFSSVGLAFSTTSNDYWQTQRNFYSTTSANFWSSIGLGFSTTSASYFLSQNTGNAFSTTSASAFSAVGLAHSTTSVTYQLSQNIVVGNSTSTTIFATTASTSRLFANNASTSVLSANTICFTADTCRTTWPAGGTNASSTLLADFNTFTGGTVFGNATTTTLFTSFSSTTNAIFNQATSTYLGVTGVLQGGSGGFSVSSAGAITRLNGTAISMTGSFLQLTNPGGDIWLQNNISQANSGVAIKAGTNAGILSAVKIEAGNAERARFTGTGQIMFGTSTPSWGMLTIATSTGPQIALIDTSASSSWTMRAASGSFYLATSTDQATSSKPVIAIDTNGLIRFPGLTNCDTIDTDATGLLTCGVDATGAGGSFSTTSADYWSTQRNFFSTTSDSFFASVGLTFSTTSSDYWTTQRNFFSTSSADYLQTQRNYFSTTSASNFLTQNQGAAFSTTSASAFTAVGLSFSTTSSAFWSSVGLGFSTSSADYWKSQRTFTGASSTVLSDANTFSGLQAFSNSGTTTYTGGIQTPRVNWTATSTGNGINLNGGCFAINGTCLSTSGGASAANNQIVYGTGSGITSSANVTYDGTTFQIAGSGTNNTLKVIGSSAVSSGLYFQNTQTTGQAVVYVDNDRGSFASYGGLLDGSSANAIGNLFGVSRADHVFLFADGANTTGLTVGTLTATPLTFGTNNTEWMRIVANGRVGVGTTSPWGIFSISSSSISTTGLPAFVISTSSNPFGFLTGLWATTSTMIAGQNPHGFVLDSGARFAIGTLQSYDYPGLLDQLTVNGRINTGDWVNENCNGVTNQSGAVSANAAAVCGQWSFRLDTAGSLMPPLNVPSTGGIGFMSLCPSNLNTGTCSTVANSAGNGAALFYPEHSNAFLAFATTTPVFEAVFRRNNGNVIATSTTYFLGFMNTNPIGSTFETEPTAGCYIVASSTTGANWLAIGRTSAAANTRVDTGIASTSNQTGAGQFIRLRIEADNNGCRFYMATSGKAMAQVANISTNVPTNTTFSILAGAIIANITSGTAGPTLDINRLRVWYDQPALNY